jgi:hypothetical protein|tara:strand:+ start:112 stop:276 length:165 start_codon:yes stop_codon:yes gene_type:complete
MIKESMGLSFVGKNSAITASFIHGSLVIVGLGNGNGGVGLAVEKIEAGIPFLTL